MSRIDQPDSNRAVVSQLRLLEHLGAIKTDESLVESLLSLTPEALQSPGQQYDQLVARIGCFAGEGRVCCRLTGLDVTDDEPSASPVAGTLRISRKVEDLV
jgi:hypothetical protein